MTVSARRIDFSVSMTLTRSGFAAFSQDLARCYDEDVAYLSRISMGVEFVAVTVSCWEEFASEVMALCVAHGGTCTGTNPACRTLS